ncbi:hypothetical protein [Streptomyces sp. NPDC088789]|uniref:hypothetical protein n=1 Tax=Streptomyces sp. NPDC088789 TaxID=3365899 RepID=UPI003811B520
MSEPYGPSDGQPPEPVRPPGRTRGTRAQQPRWAWWVIGIVIPVLGIAVTVLVARPGPADGKGGGSASSAPAAQPTGEAPGSPGYGPRTVEVDTSGGDASVEFDTAVPLAGSGTVEGADLVVNASTGAAPTLSVPDSARTLAPHHGSPTAPTAEECAASVERHGTRTATSKSGGRYCLTTDQGRTVHLRFLTADPSGVSQVEVTVW